MRQGLGFMSGIGILVLIGIGYFLLTTNQKNNFTTTPQQTTMALTITSSDFTANGEIPARFTCDGENISPELIFSNIPTGTKSLALTIEDFDVPRSIRKDGTWVHWLAWNIPPTTARIKEGETLPGIIGLNTSGEIRYDGPCPPDREHRYVFTLYALDALLPLSRGATKEELFEALTPHLIEKAQLIGRYNRK